VGTVNNPIDPLLGPLQVNGGPTETHALLSGSPAIDHIPVLDCTDTGGTPITTDQRGVARPQGSSCDIGAYEFEPPPYQPPDCSNTAPSTGTIWPPNHKFVAINVLGLTDPDGDTVSTTVDSIWQDEPVDTFGDGSFVPDGRGVGTDTAEVRAERAWSKKVPGNGRVYHIHFTADDGNGGSCSGEVLVGVPHDRKSAPIDEGPLYDSTVP